MIGCQDFRFKFEDFHQVLFELLQSVCVLLSLPLVMLLIVAQGPEIVAVH
jgi:hypothetical protein